MFFGYFTLDGSRSIALTLAFIFVPFLSYILCHFACFHRGGNLMINLVFVQYLFTGLLFHAAPFLGCWERGPRLQLLFLASSLGWLA